MYEISPKSDGFIPKAVSSFVDIIFGRADDFGLAYLTLVVAKGFNESKLNAASKKKLDTAGVLDALLAVRKDLADIKNAKALEKKGVSSQLKELCATFKKQHDLFVTAVLGSGGAQLLINTIDGELSPKHVKLSNSIMIYGQCGMKHGHNIGFSFNINDVSLAGDDGEEEFDDSIEGRLAKFHKIMDMFANGGIVGSNASSHAHADDDDDYDDYDEDDYDEDDYDEDDYDDGELDITELFDHQKDVYASSLQLLLNPAENHGEVASLFEDNFENIRKHQLSVDHINSFGVALLFEYIYHSLMELAYRSCRDDLNYTDLVAGKTVVAYAAADEDVDYPELTEQARALIGDAATYDLSSCLKVPNYSELKPWPELIVTNTEFMCFDDVFDTNNSESGFTEFLDLAWQLLQVIFPRYGKDIRFMTACGLLLFFKGNYKLAAVFFVRVMEAAQNKLGAQIAAGFGNGNSQGKNSSFKLVWGLSQQDFELLSQFSGNAKLKPTSGFGHEAMTAAISKDSAMFRDPMLSLKLLGSKAKSKAMDVSYDALCVSYVGELLRCVALSKAVFKRCTMGFFSLSACSNVASYQGKWQQQMLEQQKLINLFTSFSEDNNYDLTSAYEDEEDAELAEEQFDNDLEDMVYNLFGALGAEYNKVGAKGRFDVRNIDEIFKLLLTKYYLKLNPILDIIIDSRFNDHTSIDMTACMSMWMKDLVNHLNNTKISFSARRAQEILVRDPYVEIALDPADRDAFLALASASASISGTSSSSSSAPAPAAAAASAPFSCNVADLNAIKLANKVVLSSFPYNDFLYHPWLYAYHVKRCLQWHEQHNPHRKVVAANSEVGALRGMFLSEEDKVDYYSVAFDRSMPWEEWPAILEGITGSKLTVPTPKKGREITQADHAYATLANAVVTLIPVAIDGSREEIPQTYPAARGEMKQTTLLELFGGSFITPFTEQDKEILESLPFKVAHFNDAQTVAQQESTMTVAARRKFNKEQAIYEAHHYLPTYQVIVVTSDLSPHSHELLRAFVYRSLGVGASFNVLTCNVSVITRMVEGKGSLFDQLSSQGDALVFDPNNRSRLNKFNQSFVEGESKVIVAPRDLALFARHCKFDQRVSNTALFDYQLSYKGKIGANAKKYMDSAAAPMMNKVQIDLTYGSLSAQEKAKFSPDFTYDTYRLDVVAGETCCLDLIKQYFTDTYLELVSFDLQSETDLRKQDFAYESTSLDKLQALGATAGFLMIPVSELSDSETEYTGVKRKTFAKKLAQEIYEFMLDLAPREAPHYDFVNESFTYSGYAAGTEYIYVDFFIWDLQKFMQKAGKLKDSKVLKAYGVEHLYYHSFERLSHKVQLF